MRIADLLSTSPEAQLTRGQRKTARVELGETLGTMAEALERPETVDSSAADALFFAAEDSTKLARALHDSGDLQEATYLAVVRLRKLIDDIAESDDSEPTGLWANDAVRDEQCWADVRRALIAARRRLSAS